MGVPRQPSTTTSTSGLPRAVQLHKFEAHSAACCGVAWSAVNHHLLVSAAADGSIVFYDTTRLAVVRTLCSDQSFAALEADHGRSREITGDHGRSPRDNYAPSTETVNSTR